MTIRKRAVEIVEGEEALRGGGTRPGPGEAAPWRPGAR